MKLDLILIIGLIVNVMFAVLYPAQIFGEDPLGINGIKESKLNQYYTVNGTGVVGSYDHNTGQLVTDDGVFQDLTGAVTSTDGNAGILTTEVFGFVDWVKVGWNLLKTMLMFVVGFIFLLLNLIYPFNILIGVPFTLLYIYAMSSFIIGRS